MAATISPPPGATALRTIDAWCDSRHAVAILLGLFVAAWSAFQIVSFSPVDLHPDVLEVYGWGLHPSAGYYKHPPLGALMAAAWYAVFPAANWSGHLMAMVNAGLSLAVVDLIARRYLSGDKRLMVLLLLMLTPFYQFQAVRFGSNQTLLLTWPLAVYCFLRAFESRGILWAVAAGAAAALAMLGKYFSIYLVAGLVVAALSHPDRLRYLRSPSPWISMGAGFAVLLPHMLWLVKVDYLPFQYAAVLHTGPRRDAVWDAIKYLVGGVGYVVPAAFVWFLATRASLADMAEALWPRDPGRRMLAILLWVPLVVPAAAAPLFGTLLTPLWTMQIWFLLPILLLTPGRIDVPRRATVLTAAGVAAFTFLALCTAPVLAWIKHRDGTREGRAYYGPVSEELTTRWHAATGRPLTIVAGDYLFATAATFYSPDHPDAVVGYSLHAAPWVTAERMKAEGFAAICPDEDCVKLTLALAPDRQDVQRITIDVARTFFGAATPPASFILVLVPPEPAAQ